MLLVADIGNTSITVGIYDNDELIADFKLASDKKRSEDEYGVMLDNFTQYKGIKKRLRGAIISCVVLELSSRFKIAVEKYLGINCVVLSYKINTGIKLDYPKPSEIGADRIASSYAASVLYPCPCVVVDFGTATSFDVVDEKKSFIGGMICAGIKIQADALSNLTSKLPNVKIEAPKEAIGKTTIDAMLSGLVRGHAAMIEGLISQIEKELGQNVTLIATGGYTSILENYLTRKFDYINPNLILEGLKRLYYLNS